MAQRRLRNEPLAVTLLFGRAKIILFSTEFSSFDEGAKAKSMAASEER